MKTFALFICLLPAMSLLHAQTTVVRQTATPIQGAVCPIAPVRYGLNSVPIGCARQWEAIGGTIIGSSNNPTVDVSWPDTPGAKAKIRCKFTCSNSSFETPYLEELILSVNGQPWGSYGNLINADYCRWP